MNREILFRGHTIPFEEGDYKYEGEWKYGFLHIYPNGDHYIIEKTKPGRMWPGRHVIPETVGQFSTLEDMEGNPIYDGDIISYPTLYETPEMCETQYSIAEVVFREAAFFLKNEENCYLQENTLATEMHCYDGRFLVIGNIHDNPELLNKKS